MGAGGEAEGGNRDAGKGRYTPSADVRREWKLLKI